MENHSSFSAFPWLFSFDFLIFLYFFRVCFDTRLLLRAIMFDLKVSTVLAPPPMDEIDVLAALLREKNSLVTAAPSCYPQIQKLVDLEIWRIRQKLFHNEFKCELNLPDADGRIFTESEKLFLPKKEHPNFNFVGRIIGPRGVTSKQIEYATGCKIMIRGKGSCRSSPRRRSRSNSDKEEEDLHVIIQCEDTVERARIRIAKAKELIQQIIDPNVKGENDLKRRQLLELAILNGSYRERSNSNRSSSPHSPPLSGISGRGGFYYDFPNKCELSSSSFSNKYDFPKSFMKIPSF
uniref:K Homology domain-containing protein n=1 Tax=Panagrolaimus sp. JU765 TaxID=591449 RepID=A0AC34QPP7_9BILA